jgi:hypothetical protein
MKYEQWRKNEIRFVAMTGYSVKQFDELLPYFEQSHTTYFSRFQINGKRRSGARRFVLYVNSPLPAITERLAFILSYVKLNPLQEHQADLFNMEQKQCHEFVHSLKIVLDDALALACVLPAHTDKEFQKALAVVASERRLLHDGTEREVPRPVNKQAQAAHYSGKRKKHTVKNAVITNALCYVLFVSLSFNGSVHDKRIADENYTIPPGYTLWQDCGYQGYQPDGVTIVQPVKKPKGKELSEEQKETNRTISGFRVRIEHAIGSVKRCRIVKDECRLRKNKFVSTIFRTCAGLHNLRLSLKPFLYKN